GGVPVEVDGWGIDASYSGTQKCLGCPPGLAPITVSERATELLRKRRRPVQSWYLDLSMVEKYWGQERRYHHTAPVNMMYALHEALRLLLEEGLEASWARHRQSHEALVCGLEALGLKMFVPDPAVRAWTVNTVYVPDGVEDTRVRGRLLELFNIEIGGGLAELKGRLWRIGLMGQTANASCVLMLLNALESVLVENGYRAQRGAAVAAAQEVLGSPAG
ncbi:MAG: alanine--glyoxylate aminotransferase family protein, partial [Acidobacteria bacterium]|nr:alanine--glyoxylate aminotransferase family protein [Acidobacteriota bacterium]